MPLPRSTSLARGYVALVAATFALIVLGAVVRAKGAGLACPDWPLCFGELVPHFDLRVALEWGHRVLAGAIALGLGLLSVPVLVDSGLRERVARPLALAWGLLLVQIVLGGLTVLLRLAPWTVTAHLAVGSAFCATLLWVARDLAEEAPAPESRRPLPAGVGVLVVGVALALALQIVLGGLVSSHAAGLACAHFPTCDGRAWVPTLGGLVGLHVLHRLGAYAVGVGFVALALTTRRLGRVGALSRVGLRLVIVQIAVGAANVVSRLPVEMTALHSAMAAGLVLVTTLLVRDWLRLRTAVPLAHGSLEAAHVR